MKETKKTLTPLLLDKITLPKYGRIEIGDNLCPGLLLRVSSNGVKAFSVIYRVPGEGGLSRSGRPLAGKQHRITLGRWPIVDLPEARKKAREIIITATSGADPRVTMREACAAKHENTVSNVIARYVEREAKPSIKSWKDVESALRRIVIPEWGNRPITDITRRDAHALLDKIAQERGPKMAGEIKKLIPVLTSRRPDDLVRDIHPVMRRLLDEFGDNEKVLDAITRNIGTYGWSGSRTKYYELYEAPLKSLESHPIRKVRFWAIEMLKNLGLQKASARKDEAHFEAENDL